MIEHTKDLWTSQKGVFREEVVSLDRNNFSTFVANCGTNADSASNTLQIVADHKAAINAPHECADPQCPGDINRRKLAAFDGLLWIAVEVVRMHCVTSADWPGSDWRNMVGDLAGVAEAAIAKAQEQNSPQSDGPAEGLAASNSEGS